MVLRVDYLIFAYMFLCLCMLLFDFYYMGWRWWLKAHSSKKRKRDKQNMILALSFGNQRLGEKQMKRLARKLHNDTNLLIFHETVSEIRSDKRYALQMENWLLSNRELFLEISSAYVKKNHEMKEAFFAYIVWQYKLCGKSENDAFVQLMYLSCMEPSLYCRENALCALYVSGSAKNVVKAYLLLARQRIEHSPRLVTDGLLMFSGDHNELANELWKHWANFSVTYQTAFINYIRMTSNQFGDRFLRLLKDDDIHDEIKFAIIRYFRRYHYPDVEAILQEMVRNWDQDDWEFASIAALALENYPGDASINALLEGCHSVHWYVRENASESLLKIAEADTIQQIIKQETDPFARDILTYKWTRRQGGAAI